MFQNLVTIDRATSEIKRWKKKQTTAAKQKSWRADLIIQQQRNMLFYNAYVRVRT